MHRHTLSRKGNSPHHTEETQQNQKPYPKVHELARNRTLNTLSRSLSTHTDNDVSQPHNQHKFTCSVAYQSPLSQPASQPGNEKTVLRPSSMCSSHTHTCEVGGFKQRSPPSLESLPHTEKIYIFYMFLSFFPSSFPSFLLPLYVECADTSVGVVGIPPSKALCRFRRVGVHSSVTVHHHRN